tara:strand:+ start:1070 stop:1387 length:318 start_codon:yes stop_codon:yes gene_type:complete
MSTRATYQFITDFSDVTCYIHHDGYPQGAAQYLNEAMTAEKFIRKNEKAEITISHESHADTEYRYTIGDNFITAERSHFDTEIRACRWVVVCKMMKNDFIKEYMF